MKLIEKLPTRILTGKRLLAHLALAVSAAMALVIVVPVVGGSISIARAMSEWPLGPYESSDALVFWGTRVPRVLLGLLVGGALAVSGLAFQAVLRNPLAEPYVLGVSTGATLGKHVALLLPLSGVAGAIATPAFCFAGSLVPISILYALASRRRRISPVTVLLAGVMINVTLSAVIVLFQYFADFTRVRQAQLWGMGALDTVGYGRVAVVLPLVLGSLVLIAIRTRAMNLLSLDACTATHLGLDVRRATNTLLWAGSLLASLVVAVSGPIGFVGLTVPHALRLVFGADNRLLVPLGAVYGGVFLVACDFIGWRGMEMAQAAGLSISYTTEIPVGVVTSLIGGPLFLYLLVRGSRRAVDTSAG